MMLLIGLMLTGVGTTWAETETISASQFGFTSNTNLTGDNATLSATNFTLTFAQNGGSSVPAYNSSSKEFRIYKYQTTSNDPSGVTIASKSDNITFTKIEFSFSNLPNNYSFSSGSLGSDKKTWTGDATTSLTLSNTDTSGQLKITSMTITYENSSSGPVDLTSFAFSESTPSVTLAKSGTTFDAEYTQAVTATPSNYDGTISYSIDETNSTIPADMQADVSEAGVVTIILLPQSR